MTGVLSGPMFEAADNGVFKSLYGKSGAHYNIFSVRDENGMDALREFFPDGKANDLNFVLFSTSGVHGSYLTIEDAEQHVTAPTEDTSGLLTFLIVQPRIVCLRYGNCRPQNAEDIAYLKKLRDSSWKAMKEVGRA